ncbi:MAG: nitroreductase [Clostridia bacterium]|nr:nitroreductase [Clostridia bacterium]
MNELLTAMKERRSVRRFTPEMPKKEDLDQIIEAGLFAPSGRNSQSAIILCVTDPGIRKELMEENCKIGGWEGTFDPFYGAPVILIVLANKEVGTSIYDASLVMENLMLAAHSLGLGSIWIHRAKEEFEGEFGKYLLQKLGIEGSWEGVGHCAVGYTDGPLPPAPARKPNRVFWI